MPRTFSNGRPHTYVVKTYFRGAARLPLRGGTVSWGFKHVTARWSAGYDTKIALTSARGGSVRDFQLDGGSRIYVLFDGFCHELFRVIYNGGAYLGTGVRPQGIISAFALSPIGVVAQPAAVRTGARAADPIYRTDCTIFQGI